MLATVMVVADFTWTEQRSVSSEREVVPAMWLSLPNVTMNERTKLASFAFLTYSYYMDRRYVQL